MKAWQHDETGRITRSEESPGPRWEEIPLVFANIRAASLPVEWPELPERLYTAGELRAALNEAYAEGRGDEREVWEPAARKAFEALETCGGGDGDKGPRQWYDDDAVEAAILAIGALFGNTP